MGYLWLWYTIVLYQMYASLSPPFSPPFMDCLFSLIAKITRAADDFVQGEPLCIFYSRYGICKFGPSCKFDHPMGVFTYNMAASSSADAPVVRRLLASSAGTGALSLSSERRLSLSESRQMSSGDDNIDTEG